MRYKLIDFATLVACGRVRLLEWKVLDGRELGFDHETQTFCVAPGRFPGSA